MKTRPLPNDVIEGFTTQLGESLRREVEQLVERVTGEATDELGRVAIPEPEAEQRAPAALARAVSAIRDGQGQAAVLRSLLAGAAALGARSAIFVVGESSARLWESTGFEDEEAHTGAFAGESISTGDAAVSAVLESGHAVFIEDSVPHPAPNFGQSTRYESGLIPLRVHDKTAAIVYVDRAEDDTTVDRPGLEVLVEAAGLAVERLALARMVSAGGGAPLREAHLSGPVEAQPEKNSSFSIPPVDASAELQDSGVIPVGSDHESGFSIEPETVEDDPAVEDAKRYARLVIEEICLYHADKVDRGRTQGDLLALLGDEIDQARKHYEQRTVEEVRAKGDFFQQALVKILADGNAALLSSH